MKVFINGNEKEIDNSSNLQDIVQHFSRQSRAIIIELNGKIIKDEKRKDYKVHPGDKIELIQLVGGG